MNALPHALVTGASSGIGAAIVERLLRDGWRVTGISRGPAMFDNPAFQHLTLDLSDVEAIAGAVAGLTPTALVHAAGFLRVGRLGELSHDDGAAMWRLHVDAAERLANTLAPLLPPSGRIVFIGSRTASGAAGRGQYAASKAALVAMARSWAAELAPRGITVNVVAPGIIAGRMADGAFDADQIKQRVPAARIGTPQEVAALIAFLCSERAGYINGQVIGVNGGMG